MTELSCDKVRLEAGYVCYDIVEMLVVSVLCVDQSWRGRGLATRLVTSLLTTATSSDCQAAAVIVSSQHSQRYIVEYKYQR